MSKIDYNLILKNAIDSLGHAVEHYHELSKDNSWHNEKWITLSVHNAATMLAIYILHELNPENKYLKSNKYLPPLSTLIKELKGIKAKVPSSVIEILDVFAELNDVRNAFMHRTPPQNIDKNIISFASRSLIAMTILIARKQNVAFIEILNEISNSHDIIFKHIYYENYEKYHSYMENLIHEEFEWNKLGICPSCNSYSLESDKCLICFEEVNEILCDKCNEIFYVLSNSPIINECPLCRID